MSQAGVFQGKHWWFSAKVARVKNFPTRKYAQPKTTVNIQPNLFNFTPLKVLANTKLPQRSDGSTIPINLTSLFPPPKIYICLAAHNALVCNPPASIYYTEIFPKSVNFILMGGNFSICTVNLINGYVLKSICVLFLFFQLLGFRVFNNFQKRWILR